MGALLSWPEIKDLELRMIGVNDSEIEPKLFYKRPKLLNHQFLLERQNILLLTTKGSSTSEVLQAQEAKINKFSLFLDSIETLNSTKNDATVDKILLEGIEMLLRAVKVIKSASKQNLLLKLYKFKLRIILNKSLGQEVLVECFNECLNYSNITRIESFEEYFGIQPQLDSLIGVKILEFTENFNLQEKIKTCLNLKLKERKDHIIKELMKSIMHELKDVVIDSNSINSLLDLCTDTDNVCEYLNVIYNSNRLEFLDNSRIFSKFLKILGSLRDLPHFSSIITGFNSKIRSFLNRPEAKRDCVVANCTKFVLEFYDLGIGCISQFSDFILKCQLMTLEDCCTLTRRTIYKLLGIHLKKTGKSLEEVKFHENLTNLNLKLEFVQEMIENLDKNGFKNDHFLLSIYPEFLDESYFNILERYLKRFSICSQCFDEEFDDFFIDISDESMEKCDESSDDITTNTVVIDVELVNFLFNLYPQYIKKFKGPVVSEKFIIVLAVILGMLLEYNKVTWTDLSETFGPNSVSSTCFQNRAAFCKIYTLWLKMDLKQTLKITLRNVLNPINSAEYWLKSLFDFSDYGQVKFFNQYYNTFFDNRISCLKSKQSIIYYF